jgi:DNA-directed RNA polymerase subunit RPC12/RpoP
MPVGFNNDGEWVNINNKCMKCGHWMPLPEKNRTHCPKCGRFCHHLSLDEQAEEAEKAKKSCPCCGYKNDPQANFCIKCGSKLDTWIGKPFCTGTL